MSVILKSVVIGSFLILGSFGISCSNDQSDETSKATFKVTSCAPIEKLKWRTWGSSPFEFQITQVGSEEFKFTNIFVNWDRTAYPDFSFFEQEDPTFFSKLKAFFNGSCTLSEEVRSEYGSTGIWHEVILFQMNGDKIDLGDVVLGETIANFSDRSQLSLYSLKVFVKKRIGYQYSTQ